MNIPRLGKWLATAILATATATMPLQATTDKAPRRYSKPETANQPQRSKERKASQSEHRLPTVPTLTSQTGVLRPMDRIGSRSLLETGFKRNQAPARITSEEAGRIYGGMIYSDYWTANDQATGIYSFPIGDASELRQEVMGEDYVVTGGTFAGGKYYFVSYMSFMGMTFADLVTCDFDTWEVLSTLPVKSGSIPQDMAYDPTTGLAYGCFMNDNADGWVLGALNLETGIRRHIADLDIIIVSVGINSKGEWYGVGIDGNFYRFDKNTGERTLIGSTGVRPSYSASGCFDLSTDRFYWEGIEADMKARIYEIDLATGKANYLSDVYGNAEITGMFIPVPEAADAAPAAVTDLAFDFAAGSLAGDVTFTMPSMQFDGKATLSGNLEYTLNLDLDRTFSGTAAPGEKVSVSLSVAAPGMHSVNLVTSNAAGRSPVANAESWIGPDMPAEVPGITITRGDSPDSILLTWGTPTESANGGYVDFEAITYDITRLPDNVKVATALAANEFSETIAATSLRLYQYAVTPVYDGIAGNQSLSPFIAIGSTPTPFFNDLSTEDEMAFFSIIDANADGETWTFDPIHEAARIKYSAANSYNMPMDDWLVSPRIRLVPGRMYRFSFLADCYSASNPEKIEVMTGSVDSPEGMSVQVIEPTVITGPTPLEGWVSVDTEGVYFFGIHAISKADTFYLYASNVAIEDGPLLGTPGFVTGFKATAAGEGALRAEISGTAPSVTVEGAPLSEISEIIIRRDGTEVTRLTGIAPGAAFSYTDDNAAQSENNYTATAVNAAGEGHTASTSVYVGHDRPGLPVNVRATHNGDNSVTITWEPPVQGETGGYFDPAALTYTILRANDEVELATDVTGLTFTDPEAPLNGYRQEFYAYYVYAQSPAGYGYGLISNTVVVGKPYPMPFVETFAGGKITNDPWDVRIPESSEAYWRLCIEGEYPAAQSQDPEGGLVSFIPEEAGDTATLTSGTIDVTGAANPALEFWWICDPDSYDTVNILLSRDGGDFETIASARTSDRPGEADWRKVSVPLPDMEGTRFIQIAFEASSGTGFSNVHLDNIRVKNIYDHNLTASSIRVPARMKMSEESVVDVILQNTGLNPAEGYEVTLYADDAPVAATTGGAILPDEYLTVSFPVTPAVTWAEDAMINAVVSYGADMYEADNATDYVEARILPPSFPYISDLSGSVGDDGLVTLSWSEPEMVPGSGRTVTDGAEDYRSFAISDFGDWWVHDADGLPTFGISNGSGGAVQYENAGKPQAFIVFNPSAAGIPLEYSDGSPTEWAPHSGDQYFASFGNDGKADNWLISPELPKVAQTISFFVKSQNEQYGYEKYEVYYSTRGTEISDFVLIGSLRSAPAVWSEEKVDLPEGARYFAIRCVSENTYVFMVDDITYLPAEAVSEELSLMGYNIYRDSQRLNEKPSMEMTFTDPDDSEIYHNYAVSTVYDKGESRLSNTVRLKPTGVESVNADNVSVSAGEGFITVTAPEGMPVRISGSDAICVADFLSSGAATFNLHGGVYLVTVGRTTVKVLVR